MPDPLLPDDIEAVVGLMPAFPRGLAELRYMLSQTPPLTPNSLPGITPAEFPPDTGETASSGGSSAGSVASSGGSSGAAESGLATPGLTPGSIPGSVLAPKSVNLTPFADTVRPVALVTVLPTLPDNLYPEGSFVYKTNDAPPRLYKNVAGAWEAAITRYDIAADTITAGQIAAGAIGVSELDAKAVTADKLAVGLVGSRNLLKNGGFRQDLTNWEFYNNGDTTAYVNVWNQSATDWLLRDGDCDNFDPTDGPWGSTVAIVSSEATVKEPYLYQSGIPVVAGEVYSASVLLGCHRASAAFIDMWFYKSDGSFIGGYGRTYMQNLYKSGGPWRDGWERVVINGVTAPSEAATATFIIVMRTPYTSSNTCYLFIDQCWFGTGAYARDFDPQEAGRVRNGDGNVVIDSTGITITNGKLTMKDDSGASVLTASAFAGSWADFLSDGLYNSKFRAGIAGTLSNGRSGALPYWTVGRSGSPTVSLVADSNWPGGKRVTAQFSALSDQVYLTSDLVAATAGAWVQGQMMAEFSAAAGVVGCDVDLLEYNAAGTLVTTTSAWITGGSSLGTGKKMIAGFPAVQLGLGTAYIAVKLTLYEGATHSGSNAVHVGVVRINPAALYVAEDSDITILTLTAQTGIVSNGSLSIGTEVFLADSYTISLGSNPASMSTGGKSILRLNPDAAHTIHGIVSPSWPGKVIHLLNIDLNYTITLAHQSASAGSDVYRIICPNTTNYAIPPSGGATLWYDDGTARWRVMEK